MKIAILFGIIGVLLLITMNIMHEQVHVEIYRSYGIDSEIKYFEYFPHLATEADAPCPNDGCRLAHNINESIGYHLQIFFVMILIGFFLVISFLEKIVGMLSFRELNQLLGGGSYLIKNQ